jgi:hypothetical protein
MASGDTSTALRFSCCSFLFCGLTRTKTRMPSSPDMVGDSASYYTLQLTPFFFLTSSASLLPLRCLLDALLASLLEVQKF